MVVCKKASGYLVPAFHVPASTSVRHIVPSRSSAGQSLIATRAWLACRASLHEGGYDYATFLRWRSRALTDGAPTFFVQTQMPPYSRRERSWGGHYSARCHACLFIAGAWAMMTVAIDARRSKKFYCQGWAEAPVLVEPRFLRWTPERSTQVAFLSDPLEPISAALRSSVLLERQNVRVDLSFCEDRARWLTSSRRPLTYARRRRPFGPAAAVWQT